ncbi:hypothetical protein BKA70DRAFT_1222328 [Coprinopsis sp. MPI-PUGE-AT-0042]|nr:hypothetical protein BKA70DRAFT_1222328 [Coprinopsis sp. MPI-PUGE-AT-0042]
MDAATDGTLNSGASNECVGSKCTHDFNLNGPVFHEAANQRSFQRNQKGRQEDSFKLKGLNNRYQRPGSTSSEVHKARVSNLISKVHSKRGLEAGPPSTVGESHTSILLRFADMWEEMEKQDGLIELEIPPPPPEHGEPAELGQDGRPVAVLPHAAAGPPDFNFSPWELAATKACVDRIHSAMVDLITWLHCARDNKILYLQLQSRNDSDRLHALGEIAKLIHEKSEPTIEIEVACDCHAESRALLGERHRYDVRCALGGGFRLSTASTPQGPPQEIDPHSNSTLVGVLHGATAAAIESIRAAKGLLKVFPLLSRIVDADPTP